MSPLSWKSVPATSTPVPLHQGPRVHLCLGFSLLRTSAPAWELPSLGFLAELWSESGPQPGGSPQWVSQHPYNNQKGTLEPSFHGSIRLSTQSHIHPLSQIVFPPPEPWYNYKKHIYRIYTFYVWIKMEKSHTISVTISGCCCYGSLFCSFYALSYIHINTCMFVVLMKV